MILAGAKGFDQVQSVYVSTYIMVYTETPNKTNGAL